MTRQYINHFSSVGHFLLDKDQFLQSETLLYTKTESVSSCSSPASQPPTDHTVRITSWGLAPTAQMLLFPQLHCARSTQCTVYSVHSAQCTLRTVYTQHTQQCTLCSVHSVHCVHSVQCALHSASTAQLRSLQCALFAVCTVHCPHKAATQCLSSLQPFL